MRYRGDAGPGIDYPWGPEVTTGLPVEPSEPETITESGKTGEKFAKVGDAVGLEREHGVQDYHGEWMVPGAPGTLNPDDPSNDTDPAKGAFGGQRTVDDVQPISPHTLEQACRDLTMALHDVARKISSTIQSDHPTLTREVQARRSGANKWTIPALPAGTFNGVNAVKILADDWGRRCAWIQNEDPTNGIRISSDRQAVENGDGFLIKGGAVQPFPIDTCEPIYCVAASANAVVVSVWSEYGETWVTPKFGEYVESNKDPAMPHVARSHTSHPHRNESPVAIGARHD